MSATRRCSECKHTRAMPTTDEERVQRIENLVRKLDQISDPESRQVAHSLMEAVLELHGAGLERMMDIVFDSGDSGKKVIRQFASDNLVSSLLLLHNLHPDDMETRVQHVLGKVHGSAELVSVFEGVVHVRLTGKGGGMRQALESALRDAIPDAAGIRIDEDPAASGFVPLASLGVAAPGIL